MPNGARSRDRDSRKLQIQGTHTQKFSLRNKTISTGHVFVSRNNNHRVSFDSTASLTLFHRSIVSLIPRLFDATKTQMFNTGSARIRSSD